MCGWCFKSSGGGNGNRFAAYDPQKRAAEGLLKEHGADRSWAASYVIPNAFCPVCSEKVFFYQNAFGSRVYFDELGWPWPKHPCTDNSAYSRSGSIIGGNAIVRRKRGQIAEILAAAKTAGLDPIAAFRSRYRDARPSLYTVLEVERKGFENRVEAELITAAAGELLFLAFTSANFVSQVGEYFSFDGAESSFVDQNTLVPVKFKTRKITVEEFGKPAVQGAQ